jgi:hypothetical protein
MTLFQTIDEANLPDRSENLLVIKQTKVAAMLSLSEPPKAAGDFLGEDGVCCWPSVGKNA